jgi:hypothetical protein
MFSKYKIFPVSVVVLILFSFAVQNTKAQAKPVISVSPATTITPEATGEAVLATESAEVIVTPEEKQPARTDLTTEKKETVEPLIKLLESQKLGSWFPFNFLKYPIRNAVNAGVPPNTLVLLLLLPGIAALIASARHFVGLRGFGIFLPAALAVVFVATGPVVGIGLFLVIVFASTFARIILRKTRLKLQYLPRMSLILLIVVLGILGALFLAPLLGREELAKVSIFPVLILVLLAEDFSRVQIGKSANVAIHLTTETLILALVSYIILTLDFVHGFVLLNPELFLLGVAAFNLLMGKYVGLRLVEYWRFRKLIWG